ncbi:MAG TPA: iron donor protein CyaY [Myxococcota bacterium]|jgi:CyaY protein
MPTPITSDLMDEPTFRRVAGEVIERVTQALDAQDPDVVEGVLDAGVLKVQFPKGQPFVLNLQPPTREIWLAADRNAWHFRYDGARWLDKKGSGDELLQTLARLLAEKTGAPVPI